MSKRSPTSAATRLAGAWTWLVLAFLHLPVLLLIVLSFNRARLGQRWEGFTFAWYRELFRNRSLLDALQNSLLIATLVTLLSVALGTLAAWMLHRHRWPGARWLALAAASPLVTPEIILGVSLLMLFATFAVPLGILTVTIAHTTFCFPFVMLAAQARLHGMDPALEEAALDLGATPWQAFRLVIVPALKPALLSGALMAFTLSLDELIVTYFTAGPAAQTLPVKIYGMARVGLTPVLNAACAVLVVSTVALVLFGELLRRWNRAPATPPLPS